MKVKTWLFLDCHVVCAYTRGRVRVSVHAG